MNRVVWIVWVLLPAIIPAILSAIPDYDREMINDIFGSSLDSARYGELNEDEGWTEVQIQHLPGEDDCGPMVNPSADPPMMENHEELKVIQVIKAAQDLKCEHYKDQGYECVPYYQCDETGNIITDGYGLMDIRSALAPSEPNFGILDSSDEMCLGSLDVCCKDSEFSTTTQAPTTTTESTGGGYNNNEEVDYQDSEEESSETGGGGYIPEENPGGEDSSEDFGRNPGEVDGGDGENGGNEGGQSGEGGDGQGEGDGGGCTYGQCAELTPSKFQPKCGRRNSFGLGVRIHGFKEGESQFGEWPHICMILQLEQQQEGYTTKEVKVYAGAASLLHAGAVLTAAHKVAAYEDALYSQSGGSVGDLIVRCGEWDTQTTSEPLHHQDRKVKKIILHPEYNKRNLGYTAAILILEQEFELSQHVDTICLPDIDEAFVEDSDCHVKGWGKDNFDDIGEYQVLLKSVSVPMVDNQECQTKLRTTKLGRRFRLDPSMVCAGEEGRDACQGDGGGPLICPMKHQTDRYVQVGIVAWGIGCGTDVPGVYTSLTKIGCWIDYTLKCSLQDAYTMRYNSQDCQNWLDQQQNSDYYQRCEVSWPDRSEYEQMREKDVAEGQGKVQSTPIKIKQPPAAPVSGYGK